MELNSLNSLNSQWQEGHEVGMFSEMADRWMRANMPPKSAPAESPAQGMAIHDPAAWAEDFHRWALSRCVFRDRCFGGISALWRDFCEFQVSRDEVPCTRRTFEALIKEAGFFFADGRVYGLLLKPELDHAVPIGVTN
jgi:hypothetical protein